MTIQQSVCSVLQQLSGSLEQLADNVYSMPIPVLSGATIGQHTRHVLEMFTCVESGLESGIINYEKRARDYQLETSLNEALRVTAAITAALRNTNTELVLEAGFDEKSNSLILFSTNYYRELAYNIEHAIHHMALMKIGIMVISSTALPESYGVASSTIKYRNTKQSLLQKEGDPATRT